MPIGCWGPKQQLKITQLVLDFQQWHVLSNHSCSATNLGFFNVKFPVVRFSSWTPWILEWSCLPENKQSCLLPVKRVERLWSSRCQSYTVIDLSNPSIRLACKKRNTFPSPVKHQPKRVDLAKVSSSLSMMPRSPFPRFSKHFRFMLIVQGLRRFP